MIKYTFNLLSSLLAFSTQQIKNITFTQNVAADDQDDCPPPRPYPACNRMFLYGTLKRNEPNHHYLEDGKYGIAHYVTEGRTKLQYPMVIASKYNLPFVMYIRDVGHQVKGEIYDVDDKMLCLLDELEDHPNLYVRYCQDIIVYDTKTKKEKAIKCWMYFLVKYNPELLKLEFIECYSSEGEHGLKYAGMPAKSKSLLDDISSVVKK